MFRRYGMQCEEWRGMLEVVEEIRGMSVLRDSPFVFLASLTFTSGMQNKGEVNEGKFNICSYVGEGWCGLHTKIEGWRGKLCTSFYINQSKSNDNSQAHIYKVTQKQNKPINNNNKENLFLFAITIIISALLFSQPPYLAI